MRSTGNYDPFVKKLSESSLRNLWPYREKVVFSGVCSSNYEALWLKSWSFGGTKDMLPPSRLFKAWPDCPPGSGRRKEYREAAKLTLLGLGVGLLRDMRFLRPCACEHARWMYKIRLYFSHQLQIGSDPCGRQWFVLLVV